MEKDTRSKDRFTAEEVFKLINEVFDFYASRCVYEHQYMEYYRAKGYTDEDIDELIDRAELLYLINRCSEEVAPGQREFIIEKLDDYERKLRRIEDEVVGELSRKKLILSDEDIERVIEEKLIEEELKQARDEKERQLLLKQLEIVRRRSRVR